MIEHADGLIGASILDDDGLVVGRWDHLRPITPNDGV
jgi:hypothetical protein